LILNIDFVTYIFSRTS